MNKKLQVFVSSTYTDLKEERQTAVEAILDAGHIPAGMELFKAGKSQMKTIRKWIDESDVYMLILGGRYGSIEEESGLSYTELEYRYVLSKNMPVFAIVLDESFLYAKAASHGKDTVFEKDNVDKYNEFKKLVKKNIVRFPVNIDQISSIVHSHLNDIINDPDYDLDGWVRLSSISINSSNNVSPQIGNYTYPELIEILKNKTFPQNKNSTNVDDLRWKYWTALDIFKDYYRRFCNGIDDAYNQVCDTTFISEHFDTFEEDYHLCQYICPYFMSFNLIDYSSQEQKYLISKDGKFFYTQLEVNGELSE